MEHQTGFGGPRACELSGITYRQLDYWARTKLVTPSMNEGHWGGGSGNARRYSYKDVVGLALIKRMLDFGFDLRFLRKQFRGFDFSKLDSEMIFVVTDNGPQVVSKIEGFVVDSWSSPKWGISLSEIFSEVEERLMGAPQAVLS